MNWRRFLAGAGLYFAALAILDVPAVAWWRWVPGAVLLGLAGRVLGKDE